MQKKTAIISHCGSFDHHDMQSLNDYKLLFFRFAIVFLKF